MSHWRLLTSPPLPQSQSVTSWDTSLQTFSSLSWQSTLKMWSPVLLSLMGILHVSRADNALSTQHSPSLQWLHKRLGALKSMGQSLPAAPDQDDPCWQPPWSFVSLCFHPNLTLSIAMPMGHPLLISCPPIQAVSTNKACVLTPIYSWAISSSQQEQ